MEYLAFFLRTIQNISHVYMCYNASEEGEGRWKRGLILYKNAHQCKEIDLPGLGRGIVVMH